MSRALLVELAVNVTSSAADEESEEGEGDAFKDIFTKLYGKGKEYASITKADHNLLFNAKEVSQHVRTVASALSKE